ncbi:MAG: hypothetical protein JO345_33040 [Streptosporangiaceae bacterium]|nr:hypothetical protein [Streptosporangiaceae bacterium]
MDPADEIPWDGLEEVLRGWSGRGQLYTALAGIEDDRGELRWHQHDIEGRARRILFAQLAPLLERWPRSSDEWLNALPAQSLRQRRITDTPLSGTDWIETRTLGWPPEQFVVKDRGRIADQLMSRTLRWSLDHLAVIRRDAIRVERSLRSVAETQMVAALSLRNQPPLDATDGIRPTSADVRALKRSGQPWSRLAPVAELLKAAQAEDLITFARQHLLPDDDIRWRLFHLAVLGKLLKVLRAHGASITSLRPLSGAVNPGPAYRIDLHGQRWDLWFEAAAIWDFYGKESPYQTLARASLEYRATCLGADILLIIPGEKAHAFECKFGEAGYIARDGYLQACTYAHELLRYHAPEVTSRVVGPDPKIVSSSEAAWKDLAVGIIGPRHMDSLEF